MWIQQASRNKWWLRWWRKGRSSRNRHDRDTGRHGCYYFELQRILQSIISPQECEISLLLAITRPHADQKAPGNPDGEPFWSNSIWKSSRGPTDKRTMSYIGRYLTFGKLTLIGCNLRILSSKSWNFSYFQHVIFTGCLHLGGTEAEEMEEEIQRLIRGNQTTWAGRIGSVSLVYAMGAIEPSNWRCMCDLPCKRFLDTFPSLGFLLYPVIFQNL